MKARLPERHFEAHSHRRRLDGSRLPLPSLATQPQRDQIDCERVKDFGSPSNARSSVVLPPCQIYRPQKQDEYSGHCGLRRGSPRINPLLTIGAWTRDPAMTLGSSEMRRNWGAARDSGAGTENGCDRRFPPLHTWQAASKLFYARANPHSTFEGQFLGPSTFNT